MSTDPSPPRDPRQAALAALLGPGPQPPPDAPLPPISDELEQLLWLFAEDCLTEPEIERLCQLAAGQPATTWHFSRMLDASGEDEPVDNAIWQRALAAVQTSRQAASGGEQAPSPMAPDTAQDKPQPVRPAAPWIPDIQITVAVDHLLSSLLGLVDLPPVAAAVRSGAGEKRTSFEKQILKSKAYYRLTVDHAGRQACHVTLAIEQHQFRVPLDQLTVQNRDADNQVLETKPFVDRAARFRNLGPGRHTLVVTYEEQALDEMQLQFDPSPES